MIHAEERRVPLGRLLPVIVGVGLLGGAGFVYWTGRAEFRAAVIVLVVLAVIASAALARWRW